MRPVLAIVAVLVPCFASCAASIALTGPNTATSTIDADATCPPKPPDPTRFPLDPVELAAGRETAGHDAWTDRRGAYAYVFANAANLAKFRGDPARYEIQLGGACARMGPLSGYGNVTLHAMHDGRLYLFASKACRTAFVAAPEKYLEVDDLAPDPALATPEARARGAEILAKALEWMGGANAVDSVRTLVEVGERDEKAGERTYRVKHELQLDFEHAWARENECWDASCFGNVMGPQGAFSTGKEWKELVPVQRAAFERDAHRGLLATLRRRNAPDAIVYETFVGHSGLGTKASGSEREFGVVGIWSQGVETRLSIWADDGSIRRLEHRGRGPRSVVAELSTDLSDWRSCGSIRLPHRRVTSLVLEPSEPVEVQVDSIAVNSALDPALFTP